MNAPEITNDMGRRAYVKAVFQVTGIMQVEVRYGTPYPKINRFIKQMWPLTFTEAQQEAIMVRFMILRLEDS